eukprot:scaffold6440_cov124-Cylindrotheca_fusiformis.AAC.1
MAIALSAVGMLVADFVPSTKNTISGSGMPQIRIAAQNPWWGVAMLREKILTLHDVMYCRGIYGVGTHSCNHIFSTEFVAVGFGSQSGGCPTRAVAPHNTSATSATCPFAMLARNCSMWTHHFF